MPTAKWIPEERLADYEAARAAARAAEQAARERIPRPPPDPKYEALRAAYLATVESLKNASAPGTSTVADQNDSALDASALATQNDAAPTSLLDPSQPLPDAAPVVSVREVSSPPERSPSFPPSAQLPSYSAMAFIEIVHKERQRNTSGATVPEVSYKY